AGPRQVALVVPRVAAAAAERTLTDRIVDIDPVALLDAELKLDATVTTQRIAGEEIAAEPCVLVDVPRDVPEQALVAERTETVVEPVREVEIHRIAAEAVDQLREVTRLEGRHPQKQDVVAEHVGHQELR